MSHVDIKHIDIRYHYIREQVAAGTIVSPYPSTNDMVADVLTHSPAAHRHATLAKAMGVTASAPQSHSSVLLSQQCVLAGLWPI